MIGCITKMDKISTTHHVIGYGVTNKQQNCCLPEAFLLIVVFVSFTGLSWRSDIGRKTNLAGRVLTASQ